MTSTSLGVVANVVGLVLGRLTASDAAASLLVLDAANGVATSLLARSAQTLDRDHADELVPRLRVARADVVRRPAKDRTDAERPGAGTPVPASDDVREARAPVDAAMAAFSAVSFEVGTSLLVERARGPRAAERGTAGGGG